MTELSLDTDLDQFPDVERILRRDEITNMGILRPDLKALITYTGLQDLSAALTAIHVQNVLEIGNGNRFEALISIFDALMKNDPHFPLKNIWAVDPELSFNIWPEQEDTVYQMTLREHTLEDILPETSGRFDLILSKGVLSIGAGIRFQPKSVLDDILRAMRASLNPNNPDAVVVISSKTGLLLPFTSQTLEFAGLKPVFFVSPTLVDLISENQLAKEDLLDHHPFKIVICQKA
jgi:hypothetical protein